MKNRIIREIREYVNSTNAKGFVIGISGGKDSTIVAKLLTEAVGRNKVHGVLMPNGVQKDIMDSVRVCNEIGIRYTKVDISLSVNNLIDSIEVNGIEVSEKSITNIPPRIRMTTLYAIAQSIGYRVAGTGNKSERYIGWCTKWGDMACDYNPIKDLTCTEVIKLGDELGLSHDLVHKTPSDGLTNCSDEDNFGFTYSQLDSFIELGTSGDERVDETIKRMHEASSHKFSSI